MEVLNNYLANSVDLYGGSGSGGTTNYNELSNRPYFCNVLLQGNIILTQVINSPDDTIIIGANSIQVNKQLFYTKTQVDSLVAGISATYITATLPANPSANTYYLVGNDDDGYVLYYYDSNLTEAKVGNYTLDIDEFLKKTDITITINSSSTDLQVPSAKAVYDVLISKSSLYNGIGQPLSFTPNDAVFNYSYPTAVSNSRPIETQSFFMACADPITNSTVWGDMEVKEVNNGYVFITQTFTRFQTSAVNQTYKWRRTGVMKAGTLNIVDNKANIVWKNWFVIEYPRTTLKALPDNTQFILNNNTFSITGGLLTINIRDLSSNVDVSRVSGVNFSTIPNLHREEAYTFGTLYPLNNNTTETGGLQFQYDYVQAFGLKANVRYIGTLTVPLGY